MASSKSSPIFVAIRVRPFAPHEDSDECCVDVQDTNGGAVISLSGNSRKLEFSVDAAFDDGFNPIAFIEKPQQDRVYSVVGKPLLEQAFQGFRVAVFAYGHSGTGKTTTMIGQPSAEGLAPRLLRDLFDNVHRFEAGSRQVHFRVRMCEIHNERLRDLLCPAQARDITSKHEPPCNSSLDVRVHPKLGVYVPGLREVPVASAQEACSLFHLGATMRKTSKTAMNNESSRGHVIFTIAVEEQAEWRSRIISELSCVDLAGRENEKTTTVTGDQLVELTFINKSLFHLANCISSLQHSHRGQVCKQRPQGNLVHGPKSNMVQFRNSKLTLLLSQAISGNSCTAMVGTLSPAFCSRDETLRTLRFANSVRGIHLAATSSVRSQPKDMDAASYRQIEQLQAQLQTCRAEAKPALPSLLASHLKLPLHLLETGKHQVDEIRPLAKSQAKASLVWDELLHRLEKVKQTKTPVHSRATTSSSLLSTALPSPGATPLTSPPSSPRNKYESTHLQLETSRSYANSETPFRPCKTAKVTDQMQDEALEETYPHAAQFKCMGEPVIRQIMRLMRSSDVSTSPVKTSATSSSL